MNEKVKKIMCESLKGYIKNIEDAYLIIHAVRLGLIKTVNRRLSTEEKKNIDSGMIFIFYESQNGIKRWTDGMFWSPSRVKGPFLDYEIIDNPSLKKIYTTSHGTTSNLEYRAATKPIVLRKRTVSLKYGNIHYHIISYFREGLKYGDVSRYIFFKHLTEALNKYKDLLSDEYIERYFFHDDETLNKFGLVKANKETLKINLDYKNLEKIAVDVIMDLIKKRKKQQKDFLINKLKEKSLEYISNTEKDSVIILDSKNITDNNENK